jgi:hypothetical protein
MFTLNRGCAKARCFYLHTGLMVTSTAMLSEYFALTSQWVSMQRCTLPPAKALAENDS